METKYVSLHIACMNSAGNIISVQAVCCSISDDYAARSRLQAEKAGRAGRMDGRAVSVSSRAEKSLDLYLDVLKNLLVS